MFRKMVLGLLLGLTFAAELALAEQPYVNIEQRLSAEQLRATGLDKLSAAQLTLLNQLLKGESVKVEKAAMAEQSKVDSEKAKQTSAAAVEGHGSMIGMDVETVKTRLKGSVSGWEPGTEFQLENGQTWKVLKGSMKLRKPLQSPDVLLVPGIMGRWFLQIDEDAPKARVYRID